MTSPTLDDPRRLQAVHALNLLDTPPESEFDELVALAAQICGTPISLVSLIDERRQYFKASIGLPERETDRSLSFCAHAVQHPGLFVVPDATEDVRFRDNALVTGAMGLRFYAGVPLVSSAQSVGTLCVIDTVPRVLSESQRGALAILARQVEARFESRTRQTLLEEALAVNRRQQDALRNALNAATEAGQSCDRGHTLFRTFLDNTPYHCYLKSESGRYLYYNQKFADHFAIDREKWLGRTDNDIVPAMLATQSRAHDLIALANPGITETLGEFTGPEGKPSTFKVLKFPCIAEDGSKLLACMAIDISGELHRQQVLHDANEKLVQLAGSDALTGLSNRRTFDARLADLFAKATHETIPLSLLILDVDNFKQLNDTYGHVAGDTALRAIGRILLERCRPGDLVARIGGEEFAYILPATPTQQALELAEAVLHQIRTTPVGPNHLTASIGVSSTNFTTPTLERLVMRADDAMYVAKRSGKDRVVAHQSHIEELMKAMSKSHKVPS